jgi:hypothetical protein
MTSYLDVPIWKDGRPDPVELEKALTAAASTWQHAVADLNRRRANAGMFMQRAMDVHFAQHQDQTRVRVQFKLMLEEPTPGACDAVIKELEARADAQREYEEDDYTTQDGELALMQMAVNAKSTLVGIDAPDADRAALFEGYFYASRGVQWCQLLGEWRTDAWAQWGKVSAELASTKSAPRCQVLLEPAPSTRVCGRLLHQEAVGPGPEWAEGRDLNAPPQPRKEIISDGNGGTVVRWIV